MKWDGGDSDLKYVWNNNVPPDGSKHQTVGKRTHLQV